MSLRLKLLLLASRRSCCPGPAAATRARWRRRCARASRIAAGRGADHRLLAAGPHRPAVSRSRPPRSAPADAQAETRAGTATVDSSSPRPTTCSRRADAQPFLDGYADEWPRAPAPGAYFEHDGNIASAFSPACTSACCTCCSMCATTTRLRCSRREPARPDHPRRPDLARVRGPRRRASSQVFLAATGPGSVHARRIETGEYGQQDRGRRAAHRTAPGSRPAEGYRVELRVPLSMIGERFGVLIDDRDAARRAPGELRHAAQRRSAHHRAADRWRPRS